MADRKRLSHPSVCLRAYLESELSRRCAGNSQYSLRSFALHLGMDHSSLSQLMRGKRPLTPQSIQKLGAALKLSESQLEIFTMYERLYSPIPESTDFATRQLITDALSLVSEPGHYAILELVNRDDFVANSRWIAGQLGRTPDDVNVALTRLIRLGMLTMESTACWIDTSGSYAQTEFEFAESTITNLIKRLRSKQP